MPSDLLTTKLYIPQPRAARVARPRLVARLNKGQECKLTLVSAPAGFGKTTLLSEWASQCQWPVAWLSLDEGDNDLVRFLSYLIAALQTVRTNFELSGLLAALQSPQPPVEDILTSLANEIAKFPAPFWMVFDDYHEIETQAVQKAVGFLLEHLPTQMHLVIASRADPSLPLARLRARQQAVEIRLSDLRFTPHEAAAFLNQVMGFQLSGEDIQALAERTEGWIAGLQMAAVSMQGRDELAGFVQSFTGSHRFILDYLVEEVLQRQPLSIQSFLLKTSILQRLSGPLCDAVIGDASPLADQTTPPSPVTPGLPPTSSQAILEHLERANLFIVPLDDERRWYRYHRLFADLLHKRLNQLYPDLSLSLHRRASQWYEQNSDLPEAIEQALSAKDFARAAHLTELEAEAALMRGEITTVMGWIEALPEGQVKERPSLAFFHAWGLIFSGSPREAIEARLKSIDTSSDLMVSKMAILQAYLASFQGQVSSAAELTRQALARLPEGEKFLRVAASLILGAQYITEGDFATGKQSMDELAHTSQQHGNILMTVGALSSLADVHMRQAQLHQARTYYERALQIAVDAQGNRLPAAARPLIGLGELWREWNDFENASRCLLEGLELARFWRWPLSMNGYVSLACLRQAQGNTEEADSILEKARQIALANDTTDLDDLFVAMYRAQLWVWQGRLEQAAQWVSQQQLDQELDFDVLDHKDDYIGYHLRKYEYLAAARLWIAQEQPEKALHILEPLQRKMEQQERTRLVFETLVLQALALQALGNLAPALARLEQVLSLAAAPGFVRLFVDKGLPMQRLLEQAARQGIMPDYTRRLLAAFGAPPTEEPDDSQTKEAKRPETADILSPTASAAQQPVEPLSRRELEVLRLIAAGLSNQEIAGRLFISLSTVKGHATTIYGKLGVASRTQAAARGRALGLLPPGIEVS